MSRDSNTPPLENHCSKLDWPAIELDLDAQGYATTEPILSVPECARLVAGYQSDVFRSTVVMQRYGFGQGEYKYYGKPLPDAIQQLRNSLYPRLAEIANRWNQALNINISYPETHTEFLARCHASGQNKPTPLQLKYGPGDYNRLHQDIYGEHVFPLQVTLLLCKPGQDFSGGEFVLTEQRPRMQSRVEVIPLLQGEAVIFPVRNRPVQGSRGAYRANIRHGVSRLRSGQRHTLGIIFHDAE